jgi:hypothetical protein
VSARVLPDWRPRYGTAPPTDRACCCNTDGRRGQSQTVKANGSNTDVLALADQIITAQQAEIDEMQTLLG